MVQCCFTSTETIRTIREEEPRSATSTFTQLLSSAGGENCRRPEDLKYKIQTGHCGWGCWKHSEYFHYISVLIFKKIIKSRSDIFGKVGRGGCLAFSILYWTLQVTKRQLFRQRVRRCWLLRVCFVWFATDFVLFVFVLKTVPDTVTFSPPPPPTHPTPPPP